jgi:hypothetical protein
MRDLQIEGWYTDPYGRHEARWMSQGEPTHLVEDGGIEGDDSVATGEPFTCVPVRIDPDGPGDGTDRLRADDAQTEGPYDASEASRAASDVYDQTQGGALPLHRRYGK